MFLYICVCICMYKYIHKHDVHSNRRQSFQSFKSCTSATNGCFWSGCHSLSKNRKSRPVYFLGAGRRRLR